MGTDSKMQSVGHVFFLGGLHFLPKLPEKIVIFFLLASLGPVKQGFLFCWPYQTFVLIGQFTDYVGRLLNDISTIFIPYFRNKIQLFKKWVGTSSHPPLQMFLSLL